MEALGRTHLAPLAAMLASHDEAVVAALYKARRQSPPARPLALLQLDVAAVRPPHEAVDGVGQSRAPFGQVRGVDLGQVAHADNLGPGPARVMSAFLFWMYRGSLREFFRDAGATWRRGLRG